MHRRADNQAEKNMEHEMETVGSGVGDCNPEFETSGIGCASIHYCNSPTSIIGYDNRNNNNKAEPPGQEEPGPPRRTSRREFVVASWAAPLFAEYEEVY